MSNTGLILVCLPIGGVAACPPELEPVMGAPMPSYSEFPFGFGPSGKSVFWYCGKSGLLHHQECYRDKIFMYYKLLIAGRDTQPFNKINKVMCNL